MGAVTTLLLVSSLTSVMSGPGLGSLIQPRTAAALVENHTKEALLADQSSLAGTSVDFEVFWCSPEPSPVSTQIAARVLEHLCLTRAFSYAKLSGFGPIARIGKSSPCGSSNTVKFYCPFRVTGPPHIQFPQCRQDQSSGPKVKETEI